MSFDSDFNTTSDSRFRSDEGLSGRSSMPQTSPAPDHEIEDIINNTGNARPPRHKETPAFSSTNVSGGPAGDLTKLKQAWISERTAPELLPFLHDEVDRIMEKIRNQMEYIEVYSMNLGAAPDTKLKLLIVETDLERTKFVLRGYLRTRLSKIDKYTIYFIETPSQQRKLSHSETDYMIQHHNLLLRLYNTQFMNRLPEQLRDLNDKSDISMVEKPDLRKTVFIRVLEDIPESVQAGNEAVLLEKYGIYALRYSSIRKHVRSGAVVLI